MKIYVYSVLYHCTDDSYIETEVYTDFAKAKKALDLSHQINLNELEDAFDEFSDSIDDNEKRNILINI